MTKSGVSSLPSMSPLGLHPIERMLANGDLPIEPDCIQCGCQTNESLSCIVQCEAKGGRLLDLFPKPIVYLLMPIWFLPLMRRSMEASDTSAEDRFIELAIRLCDRCQNEIPLTPGNLKKLACKTPIFRDLFEEFPKARIQAKRTDLSRTAGGQQRPSAPPEVETSRSAYCSTCRKEVAIDEDDRCLQCRWPV